MIKTVMKSVAVAAALLMPASAMASVAKPPVNFQGQWWTHPIGCEYSRAGRPGETVWFLIINTAKPGCPTYIATKTWGGVYQAEGRKM
ncbi:MAG: hypothetical protein AAFN94_04825 [Pseudomonadota bacterium]